MKDSLYKAVRNWDSPSASLKQRHVVFLWAFISLMEACQKRYTPLRLYVNHFECSWKLSLEPAIIL